MRALVLLIGLLAVPLAAEDNPADLYPSSLGFAYSNLTGSGFTYRWMDSHSGWQVSGMATSQNVFNLSHPDLYTVGAGWENVLFSFAPLPVFFSQFYWLAGASWKTESYNPPEDYGEERQPKTWTQQLTAGPGLGLEIGLFRHWSVNLEAGYLASYNFAESSPDRAFALGIGFTFNSFFRY